MLKAPTFRRILWIGPSDGQRRGCLLPGRFCILLFKVLDRLVRVVFMMLINAFDLLHKGGILVASGDVLYLLGNLPFRVFIRVDKFLGLLHEVVEESRNFVVTLKTSTNLLVMWVL